jgi:aminomethyltransferase
MKNTKFVSVHQKLNAKLVDFAGFNMPVQYNSIIAEHMAVRNSVGVFDVSHMGEIRIKGSKALDFVQHITINDASKLFNGRVQYSAMCYPDGGIVDDLLVYKIDDDEYFLVVNASNMEKDFNWMNSNNKFGVEIINESDDYSLLAIQGPNSKEVVQALCDKNIELEYYHFFFAKFAGVDALISRTGYTGELGYEVYLKVDEKTAIDIWDKLFEAGKKFNIQPIGLGARDSLRLEMGYCLYGNDIDQTTNPLEAGLGWITKLNKGDFIGKESIQKVKESGLKRKLIALVSNEKAFPRHGYSVCDNNKNIIGNVTSGTSSPVLNKPIAMAYVDINFTKPGSQINFLIRDKMIPAEITSLPFVKK